MAYRPPEFWELFDRNAMMLDLAFRKLINDCQFNQVSEHLVQAIEDHGLLAIEFLPRLVEFSKKIYDWFDHGKLTQLSDAQLRWSRKLIKSIKSSIQESESLILDQQNFLIGHPNPREYYRRQLSAVNEYESKFQDSLHAEVKRRRVPVAEPFGSSHRGRLTTSPAQSRDIHQLQRSSTSATPLEQTSQLKWAPDSQARSRLSTLDRDTSSSQTGEWQLGLPLNQNGRPELIDESQWDDDYKMELGQESLDKSWSQTNPLELANQAEQGKRGHDDDKKPETDEQIVQGESSQSWNGLNKPQLADQAQGPEHDDEIEIELGKPASHEAGLNSTSNECNRPERPSQIPENQGYKKPKLEEQSTEQQLEIEAPKVEALNLSTSLGEIWLTHEVVKTFDEFKISRKRNEFKFSLSRIDHLDHPRTSVSVDDGEELKLPLELAILFELELTRTIPNAQDVLDQLTFSLNRNDLSLRSSLVYQSDSLVLCLLRINPDFLKVKKGNVIVIEPTGHNRWSSSIGRGRLKVQMVAMLTEEEVFQKAIRSTCSANRTHVLYKYLAPAGTVLTYNHPNSPRLIEFPVRSHDCQHIQCFDLKLFINDNRFKSVWTCPVDGCHQTFQPNQLEYDSWMYANIQSIKKTV